ncbi:MAG TPA: tRNA 2-thiouridine(34) synthase MnmA [Acidimicrobiales bacterium]|jgi:tRNA-specific 2-thiouridylase|nr:tRNA 2-thiouridine(34) synthase MnmA [Acidimicrobiales bacterium]
MRVLVAMSGGVDSSVAAALLQGDGHEVVGATMKLWGGPSDTGCCSVSDVDDARRVAQQIGIDHHVFNFTEDFDRWVVDPYTADHAAARTPNPCIECNRHLKFDRFLERGLVLGFDAVATGHHARVVAEAGGRWSLRRGADQAKDQSYVLHMLGQYQLARVLLPVGGMTKVEVREVAGRLGLRTASKPDSQDVCFIPRRGGRHSFLSTRIDLRPGRVLDQDGSQIGTVPAVEMVTVGQRKGLGPAIGDRYVTDVDAAAGTVTVGPLENLLDARIRLDRLAWVDAEPAAGERFEVQMSAHGQPVPGQWEGAASAVVLDTPVRRVAPGQSVVLYRGDAVVGGGTAVPG